MQDLTTMHFITVFSIWAFKLATLIVGYLITRMGYDLLVKGVTGGFEFRGDISGVKADLVSASPGLLFLVLGVALMATSVLKENKFSTSGHQGQAQMLNAQENAKTTKPVLLASEN